MSDERQRVLRMLKEGKVTVEEAEALLEALEEEATEPAGVSPGAPGAEAGPRAEDVPAGAEADASGEGPPRAADAEEGRAGPRGEFQRLLDDIMKAVDVDGIRETVRESLRRSKIDVGRVKEEVLRATERVRDESRRAAREYRRSGWGYRISRTIEGLWGLTPAAGSWTHETALGPGRTLAIHNVWGDVRLRAGSDGRLRVAAVRRAWGRDDEEARYVLEAVTLTAADEGAAVVIKVHPPSGEFHRRFRVDFDVQVPSGVSVEVEQAKGDVVATGLAGALAVRAASGDVSVREHGGPATVHLMHGDIEASGIKGAPMSFDLETARGDIRVEVEQFQPGSASRMRTMSGDLAARLGEGVRCRISARVTSGEIRTGVALTDQRANRRSLEGVVGAADASLELSTVSGDITIEGLKSAAGPAAPAGVRPG